MEKSESVSALVPVSFPLYNLFIKCPKTGFTRRVTAGPIDLTFVQKEKELFERHIDPKIANFVIEQQEKKIHHWEKAFNKSFTLFLERREKMFEEKKIIEIYEKKEDCLGLYNIKHTKYKYANSRFDAESAWVENFLVEISIIIYIWDKESILVKKPCNNIFGSLWHLGLINYLVSDISTQKGNKIKQNFKLLGDKFDPNIFKRLEGSPGEIYLNFNSGHVEILCDYCEKLFGVNRFEVARLFDVVDVSVAINRLNSNPTDTDRPFIEERIASIYAEMDDIPNAKKYYNKASVSYMKLCIQAPNTSINVGQPLMNKHLANKCVLFQEYLDLNGTSVLHLGYVSYHR